MRYRKVRRLCGALKFTEEGSDDVNALEIIAEVRAHQADVVLNKDRLVVQGHGERLPSALEDALQEHRAEIMVALGAPIERSVAAVLADIRPHLAPALQQLTDGDLLRLVNLNMIMAWYKCMAQVARP
jgi:hypothetical protein